MMKSTSLKIIILSFIFIGALGTIIFFFISDTKTSSGSPDAWGPSPFSSGSQLTVPGYTPPNTEWPTRTITLMDGRRVTFVFGEGNPKEAQPLSEKEKSLYESCAFDPEFSQYSCGPLGDEVFGYVTSEIEYDLLSLVSHPAWERILTHCSEDLVRHDQQDTYPSEMNITLKSIIDGTSRDIEKWITLNPNTGRKEIGGGHFLRMHNWFNVQSRERGGLSLTPCFQENGGVELQRLFDVLQQKLLRPNWIYPERIAHPEKYQPWQ